MTDDQIAAQFVQQTFFNQLPRTGVLRVGARDIVVGICHGHDPEFELLVLLNLIVVPFQQKCQIVLRRGPCRICREGKGALNAVV